MKRRRAWFLPALVLALGADLYAEPVEVVAGGAMPEILLLSDVSFPHRLHSEGLGVSCQECHHETNAAQLATPHDQYFDDFWIECATCHRAEDSAPVPQACSNCHHSSPRSIADETLSVKVVIHQRCWSCHEVGTGQAAGAQCATCHSKTGLRFTQPKREDPQGPAGSGEAQP